MLVSLTCMCLNRHSVNIQRGLDPYENIFQLFLVDKVFCKYLKNHAWYHQDFIHKHRRLNSKTSYPQT